MTDIGDTLRAVLGRKLTDVLVAGYLDEGHSIKQFHPMFEHVYFDFDGILLRASAINQYWNLEIRLVDRVKCEFDVDADDECCAGSVRHTVLRHPEADNVLRACVLYIDEAVSTVKCMAFQLQDPTISDAGDTIFVDPEFTFGIHLGGASEFLEWKDTRNGRDPYPERRYSI